MKAGRGEGDLDLDLELDHPCRPCKAGTTSSEAGADSPDACTDCAKGHGQTALRGVRWDQRAYAVAVTDVCFLLSP